MMACIYCGETEFAYINQYPDQRCCVACWLCLPVDADAMVGYAAYINDKPEIPMTFDEWRSSAAGRAALAQEGTRDV